MPKWINYLGIIFVVTAFLMINLYLYNSTLPEETLDFKHQPLGELEAPLFLGEIKLGDNKKPAWLHVYESKLYVSYFDAEKIDILNSKGEKISDLKAKINMRKGAPQSMFKYKDRLVVTDYKNGGIGFFNEDGKLLDAFFETAEKRPLVPVGAAVYGDVFYFTDRSINGWMAVLPDGEMIMEVKGDDINKRLEFPYALAVTSDGRVFVTDPEGGKLKVFACAGWYGFDIDTGSIGLVNPQGIAIDGSKRIHVVDNGSGKIFVFDNSGEFMFSYGNTLVNPSNIAIDHNNRIIYIANTGKSLISVWGY